MDKQQQVNLKITFAEGLKGIDYSNIAFVNNTSEEFLLDFGTVSPGKEGVEIFERVALSPRNAKLFASAVVERVKAYEAQYGEIKVPEAGK